MKSHGFDILYEHGPCLVVNKPGGVLTQAPPGIDSLEVRIKQFLKERDHKTGNVYLGVPHRLDRPVSGVMVFAKHVRAARRTAEQFQGRIVRKKYWAFVEHKPSCDEGTWTDWTRKVPGEARAEIVGPKDEEAREATLRYKIIGELSFGCWIEFEPITGRMHQIRIQAASRGHPILGDDLYGSNRPFGPEVEDPRAQWIALHARSIEFRHPMTREKLVVTAPLPVHWTDLGINEYLIAESV
jgi:23S rRNA pseudouridine1911/1915/1917 synthase